MFISAISNPAFRLLIYKPTLLRTVVSFKRDLFNVASTSARFGACARI